jgi:hypothetical protein
MRGLSSLLLSLNALAAGAFAQGSTPPRAPENAAPFLRCDQVNAGFCLASLDDIGYEGRYIGHDEPALLFYSNVSGSGNSGVLHLTLPKDPPVLPRQDGTGGVFNFQLRSKFWFGMVLCDSESSPEFTRVCVPDSDANIFDNPDPAAPDFIGHHPGAAYLEVQFYPPSWASSPCFDPTHWCAAVTVTSNSFDQGTNLPNNQDCLNKVGLQPFNLAFLTRNGVPVAPGNPLGASFGSFHFDPDNVLKLDSGDRLLLEVRDTPHGVRATIRDLTSGKSGSMTASADAGFGQVVYDPNATLCQIRPYDFHPMFSTSGPHTRTTWSAHSVNVAVSDEIGHFELCAAVDAQRRCIAPGPGEPGGLDRDDTVCFAPPSPALPPPLVQIGGCFSSDIDFDGASYQPGWPGAVAGNDQQIHPTPLRFTSPRFFASEPGHSGPHSGDSSAHSSGDSGHHSGESDDGEDDHGRLRNYGSVAFEADLPAVERAATPPCVIQTGVNCVNPPPGANFYPIYSTTQTADGCVWQLGGAHIPGTLNSFGGSSVTEFGTTLLPLIFPRPGTAITAFLDFQRALPNNPCPASDDDDED